MDNSKKSIFQRKLSYKIGTYIILSVVLVSVASGLVYTKQFTSETEARFKKQLEAPANLMSMGKLRYDAAMDEETMSNLVGGEVIYSLIVGQNKKIYYSNDSSLLDKNVSDVSFLNNYDAFNKQIEESEHFFEDNGNKAVCISPLFFDDGTYIGFLFLSINTEAMQANKAVLIRTFVIGGLATLIILTVIIIVFFRKYITDPIAYILKGINKIAQGDLTVKLDTGSSDELGQITNSLNDLSKEVSHIIKEIIDESNRLSMASESLQHGSSNLSQEASQLASIAEEAASSMEQMVSNIQVNTENAQNTEKITKQATDEMKNVERFSEDNLKYTKQIAEKITIINDIAFQTNLLALNAAVEAARAGEFGRGFSVVASEVKKLAENSRLSADQIQELSNTGLGQTEKSVESIRTLQPEFLKAIEFIKEISISSREQATGAEQVNEAIQRLNQISQENSSGSDSLNANAVALSKQAEKLKNLAGYFTI